MINDEFKQVAYLKWDFKKYKNNVQSQNILGGKLMFESKGQSYLPSGRSGV
jgi:hypothetical protein